MRKGIQHSVRCLSSSQCWARTTNFIIAPRDCTKERQTGKQTGFKTGTESPWVGHSSVCVFHTAMRVKWTIPWSGLNLDAQCMVAGLTVLLTVYVKDRTRWLQKHAFDLGIKKSGSGPSAVQFPSLSNRQLVVCVAFRAVASWMDH